MEKKHKIEPIGYFSGTFPQKFGIPRQAHLIKHAVGDIHLIKPYNHPNCIEGLELYSHIWLTFGFHENHWNGKAKVRPQRLGGNRRMGVFATRSSFRPNGLGLSAVKLNHINYDKGIISVSEHDLLDGTPLYCIKPYIPFSDMILEAKSEFVTEKPKEYDVEFSEEALKMLSILERQNSTLKALIVEVVSQDPTPQYHKPSDRIYGVRLYHYNILFQKREDSFFVIRIEHN